MNRRVQIVEIQGDQIEKYFTGEMTVIEGLPDDASLVKTWDEPARQTYCFMFESDEFNEVEQGAEAPRAELAIAERRVNAKDHWVCPNCHDVLENGDVR